MRRQSLRRIGVGLGLCLVLTAGCAQTTGAAPQPSTGTPAAGAPAERDTSVPAFEAELHEPDAHEPHDELVEPSLGAMPSWGPADRVSAAQAGESAVAAYIAGGDPETWWARVAPLLSPVAQQAYAGTDPANVPGRTVGGPAAVDDEGGSAYLAEVVVPTDTGKYGVLLSRAAADDPWVVERFRVPTPEPLLEPRP